MLSLFWMFLSGDLVEWTCGITVYRYRSVVCASWWTLQGVKISISTVRNVNIEFISPYSTKQRLLRIRLIVIDSNLSTTWKETEGATFHIWPSVLTKRLPVQMIKKKNPAGSSCEAHCNWSLKKHWRTGQNWFSIMAWCQWFSQHTAFGTMTKR